MKKMEMTTLTRVMEKLKERGYKEEFIMGDGGKLYCTTNEKTYAPEHIVIDQTYRFEGDSDPADTSVLYSLSTDTGEKGIYVDGYGTSSSQDSSAFAEFIKKVHFRREDAA